MSDKTAATWHGRDMTGREVVTKALLDEGAGPGGSVHSWRCEYPDRYGPCDCVEQTSAVIVDALARAGYGDVRALLHDLRTFEEGAVDGDDWDVAHRLRTLIARHTPPANDQENP